MVASVFSTRIEAQMADVLAGKAVRGVTAADVAALVNHIAGRGMQTIPAYHPGKPTGASSGPALAASTAHTFRFWFDPAYPALERRWSINALGATDLDITAGSATLVTASATATRDIVSPITIRETLAAQTGTAAQHNLVITPNDAALTPWSISCQDYPRASLVEDASDLGTDLELFRTGQPMKREDLDQIIAALVGTEVGRRVLVNWAVPDTTAFAAQDATNAFVPIWADPIPVLARKLGRAATTGTLTCSMYAWTTSGTGNVRIKSDGAGNTSSSATVTSTPGWTTAVTLAVDCTDLTVADGRRSTRWDGLEAEMQSPLSQTIYVASVAIWEA